MDNLHQNDQQKHILHVVTFRDIVQRHCLNASHWFTVFHLRSVLHLMNGFGTGINYFCRLMWPVAVTAACNLYTCTCKSKQYNIHLCCVNYYKFKVFLRLQIWILDNPKNIISTYFCDFYRAQYDVKGSRAKFLAIKR